MTLHARVWRAGTHEAGEVTRLLLAFRDWFGGERPDERDALHSVGLLLEDPATEFLLAAVDEQAGAHGVCQLRFRHSLWMSADDCWLEDLFVEEQARRRGVGQALVEAACVRASERGATRIELDTNETNAAAIALYERCGFSAASKSHDRAGGRDLLMGRRLERLS
ncbi:MAG: GNAT family N-acetyltransferase [Solirubrobacteraceae bacterium]|jgi:ribosomal protein S18 acetylase RimI-like enzyme